MTLPTLFRYVAIVSTGFCLSLSACGQGDQQPVPQALTNTPHRATTSHSKRQNLAYVSDESDALVYVVNLATGTIVKTVLLGGSPNGLTVANGNVWVANNMPGGGVFRINTTTYVVAMLNENGGPATVAFSKNTATVYALDYFAHTVTAINATTGQTLAVIADAGALPQQFDLDAVNKRLYEVPTDGTLKVIDTTTNTIVATMQLGTGYGGNGVVLSPDGSRAYVAVSNYGVVVLDTASGTPVATLLGCPSPDRMARSSDGSQIYAFCDDGTVDSFNASALTLTKMLSLDPGHVFGRLATSNDGTTLYVPSNSNKVFVLDAGTLNVLQTISVTNPQAIAL